MLRRDFETFFLGTAMTISNRAGSLARPKKTAAALQRRGGRLSVYKTSRRRNNLASAALLVSEGREPRERMPTVVGRALTAFTAWLGQHVLETGARPPGIRIGRQRQLLGHDLADIEQISRQRFGCIGLGTQDGLTALQV